VCLLCVSSRPPSSTLFPYTTLFRSCGSRRRSVDLYGTGLKTETRCTKKDGNCASVVEDEAKVAGALREGLEREKYEVVVAPTGRSEEHTSELQSRGHLVCRLLLEKK